MRRRIISGILGEAVLATTAARVARTLASGGIPHLIVGGYALQKHGYARFTADVDVVVPDVAEAHEFLSMRGFREKPGSSMSLTDRNNPGVDIDLLPGGKTVGPSLINLPMPEVVSAVPRVASIEELVSQKLSSFAKNAYTRMKDGGDVTQLIMLNHLPRDLAVDPAVQHVYIDMWDKLQAESNS